MTTQLELQPAPVNQLEQEFLEFHGNNPMVYELFKRFAFEAIWRGCRHLSAGLVAERIRWETDVETDGDGFKINNNHRAYYARLFVRDYPEHAEFFRTRTVKYEHA